jgi:AraC-like DNA-binding protein
MVESPFILRDSTDMSADPLSDALGLVAARCVVTGGFAVGGDWSLLFWPQARLKLCAVVRGSCWLAADGLGEPLRLVEGDVIVLNDRSEVVLASDPELPPIPSAPLFAERREPILRLDDTTDVVVIGGHVELSGAGEDLLLGALPPVKCIGAVQASVLRWLLDRTLAEMSGAAPGAEVVVHHHSQLLFVEVLRACLSDASSFPAGWLRALADDRLAPALRLMHAQPERTWSLMELANAVSMSRTTFIDRFKAAAGMPPLTYLLRWRMHLAERSLREDDVAITQLAPTLGYTSESAFSNAFKRTFGVAPRRYREKCQTPPAR